MKKIILLFLLVLGLLMSTFIESAYAINTKTAKDEIGNISIESNQKIDDNLFTAGNTVSIKGVIEDDLFVAGNIINIEGEIKGNLFAAGNTINISGKINKDAFLAGNMINIQDNANIARDIAIGANSITINGKIGRNVFSGSSMLSINGQVEGDINAGTSSINIGDNAKIEGKFKYTNDKELNIQNSSLVKKGIEFNQIKSSEINITLKTKIITWLLGLIQFIILGIIFVLIIPKYFQKISEIITKNTLKNIGVGFIIFAIIPIAIFITIITIIGIPLSMIILGLFVLFSFLAKYWCAYCLGKYIGKNKYSPIVAMIVGATLLQILFFIPIIGFVAKIIILFIGLGAIYLSKPLSNAK